jgi:diguanylate cyclase (GGDEF)-like protein/PAS domain S-box-containing protein
MQLFDISGARREPKPAGENPARTILLVENDPDEAQGIRQMFDVQVTHAFELTLVDSVSEAEKYLDNSPVDIVLLDFGLPDAQGLDAVRRLLAARPRVSIVLLSSMDDEPFAAQAIQEGAQDYLIKGEIGQRELMRTLLNVAERARLEEAAFAEKERAEVTLDCIGDAVICTDTLGNITFLNRVAERMTGWMRKDAIGRAMTETCRIMDAATRKETLDPLEKAATQDRFGKVQSNCFLIRRDGNEVFIEDSVAPICDREGRATGAVIVFRDVTATRALEEILKYNAQHDALTGLPNRVLLNDRVGQAVALARRQKLQTAVLFMDLDGFKHINDSLGHQIGDKLLQSVAGRLVDCVRTPDTVSRQGGDEFVVLLQELHHPEDAAITAARLLKAVAEPHSIDHHRISITGSIGISLFPDDAKDADTLFSHADIAMYRAKRNVRSSYQFFRPEIDANAMERHPLDQDLYGALERNEFKLHFQAKIDLKTKAIVGAEALLRWIHPTRGTVPPLQFLPIAEASGLILPIGKWVLREACTQARAWADAGVPARTVAVNISGMQFQSEDFLESLFATLAATGLDPGSLELDIPESVLMSNPGHAIPALKALREKGIKVSIDNYGTGYSSLSALRDLSLVALKIDRSIVQGIAGNPYKKNKASAIISMGQSLNLRVIAGGVETAECLNLLCDEGCDEAQGFYLGEPVPAGLFASGVPGASRSAAPLC